MHTQTILNRIQRYIEELDAMRGPKTRKQKNRADTIRKNIKRIAKKVFVDDGSILHSLH